MVIDARLKELGIDLPSQPTPAAHYAPFVKVGSLLFVSGQLPVWNGEVRFLGKIGHDLTLEEGQEAARLCALNLIAQVKVACNGNLDHITQCVRLGGFVNSTDDFKDQPKVMDGASNLILAVFQEKGRHARAAVGVNALPLGVSVEVEGIFEVRSL